MYPELVQPCVTLNTKWYYYESDIPVLETCVFDISVFNYLGLYFRNRDAIFIEMCKIHANQMVIKVAVSIINSYKLSRSY